MTTVRRRRQAARTAAAIVLVSSACAMAGGEERSRDRRPVAAVVASCPVPAGRLSEATPEEPAVMLGGISDLCVEPNADAAGWRRAWVVTDRGPNGTVEVDGREHRTLAAPSFAPRILELAIAWDASHADRVVVRVTGSTVLHDRDGTPLTGRPNGLAGDPSMLDPAGRRRIEADPDGVDTEGLARTRCGTWWLAEEYRPSLLEADAAGRARTRFVPDGTSIPGSGMDVVAALPDVYARRRDNRGFEGLAIAPDDSRLFAVMQSPLEVPDRAEAERTGNVRLLAFDPQAGMPLAEYVYRLGDPESRSYRKGRSAPVNGKLCAITALGPATLLVLEQADGGLASLYRADLDAATDTLPRTRSGGDRPLEAIRDLHAAGVVPVAKTLLADLGPQLDTMRSRAGLEGDAGPLKIEGLAVADERHLFLVNDDDFGVNEDAGGRGVRSCLWVVRLPAPLAFPAP